MLKVAHRILTGCDSSDNDRVEYSPVRFSGAAQGSDSEILEVPKGKTDTLDSCDQDSVPNIERVA